MRAALITGKDTLELLEFDEPSPADDEVVLAIQRCGICGSDVHAYVEGWNYSPGVCGHEWVGHVAAAGRSNGFLLRQRKHGQPDNDVYGAIIFAASNLSCVIP